MASSILPTVGRTPSEKKRKKKIIRKEHIDTILTLGRTIVKLWCRTGHDLLVEMLV